ncbi:hypothetical protein AMTR_s00016p00260880 [Amborella trichopoda]|uniref:Pentacotripeptide-repeat region of PRORP domain-containing protein n=1 Tax=Amborella trichopoda TaxID=13333 RepID=W1PH85_AMBTC|nr:hypothetical protein AMTR_s00016p00260880 [Amborella trichopoda]
MEDNCVLPNDVTYGVVIKSYHKEGRPSEALSLLNEKLEKKFMPCPTPCCKFFYLICKEGKVDEACMLWKKLLKRKYTRIMLYSTLIYWLCKGGKLKAMRKLFDEFEKGFYPSTLTYNRMGSCKRQGDYGMIYSAKRVLLRFFTYNRLIKGFSSIGRAIEGFSIFGGNATQRVRSQ